MQGPERNPQNTTMEDGTLAPSNVIINGQEYSPEDAQELISLGSKTRELETKWNTPVDSLMPAYTKSREELKATQAERDEARQQIAQFQAKQNAGTDTNLDRQKAREAAKELGFVLDDDIKDKFVSRDDLDKYFTEREQTKQAVDRVLEEASNLEKEIDGSDGRPKFYKKQVLAYAQSYGFSDLKAAYEDMHQEQLTPWKESQIQASKNKGLKTLSPSGNKKEPEAVKVNDDNVKSLLTETLWGKS